MPECRDRVKAFVQDGYRRLYRDGAHKDLPIVHGKALARRLGYDARLVDMVPEALWARFFPCGNPVPWIPSGLPPGASVLNLGAGVGLDGFFLLPAKTAPVGPIINVDVAREALSLGKAFIDPRLGGHGADPPRVYWVQADGERLPFHREAFHLVLMNGVFNLFETKEKLLAEVHRVLKKTGALLMLDLVRTGPLPPDWGSPPEGWLWCVNGSLEEGELREVLEEVGFGSVEIVSRNCEADPFWTEVIRARKIGG
ncbi:MAG: methyltransferase domain-containing protein [Desulfosoma sp.]